MDIVISEEEEEEEETFEAAYSPGKTPHLIKKLQRRGSWMDDYCVLHLFNLMAWKKGYRAAEVRMIDSVVAESMLRSRGQRQDRWHLAERFSRRPPPLILLPLVCGAHWSLLALRTGANRWYHLDSAHPYHAQLAARTLADLRAAAVVGAGEGAHRVGGLAHQAGDWECGLYVLQYALMLVESSREAGQDERAFVRILGEHVHIASDKNLLLFTQRVLRLLESVK